MDWRMWTVRLNFGSDCEGIEVIYRSLVAITFKRGLSIYHKSFNIKRNNLFNYEHAITNGGEVIWIQTKARKNKKKI